MKDGVNLAAFDAHLDTVGLISNTGQKKKGFDELKAVLEENFEYPTHTAFVNQNPVLSLQQASPGFPLTHPINPKA